MVRTRSRSRQRSSSGKKSSSSSSRGSSKKRTASPRGKSPRGRSPAARSRKSSSGAVASEQQEEDDSAAASSTSRSLPRRSSSRLGRSERSRTKQVVEEAAAAVGLDLHEDEVEISPEPFPPVHTAEEAELARREAQRAAVAAAVAGKRKLAEEAQKTDPLQGKYLSPMGLQTLKEYKYMSGFTGATDKYVMIPLWNWCLQFVPIWMAPNLLTTWSLACGILCYFLFQFFSPDFLDHPPSWVFFLTSFLMFLYLILDGLDGKQARRTGSSGPLGQLFDHGCDSICCFVCTHEEEGETGLELFARSDWLPAYTNLATAISLCLYVYVQLCGIFMCSVLHLGGHKACFVVLLLHILPFYTSNWEEYCTGVMRFGIIGITEGQLFIIFLLALTGVLGVDAWDTALVLPAWVRWIVPLGLQSSVTQPMEAKFLLVGVGVVGVLYQVASSCMSVYEYHVLHRQQTATRRVYNKAKRMYAHHLTFLALGAAWVFAPSHFFAHHPRVILLTVGILFGYQVSRLIISRVTADPYPFLWLNTLMAPMAALVANCYMGERFFPTYPVAMVYLALVTLAYIHFVVSAICQICDFLHIRCFKIIPKLQAQ